MYFYSKCSFKDVLPICNENIENCSTSAACRFEKWCFEKNALKLSKRVRDVKN